MRRKEELFLSKTKIQKLLSYTTKKNIYVAYSLHIIYIQECPSMFKIIQVIL